MTGKLYGIGVGPGDPGLMTLRAKEILERCGVVGYPVRSEGEGSVAFDIASQVVDMSSKTVAEFVFSMNPRDSVREKCREVAINRMCSLLDEGSDIAMVTLGDVGVYSTYMYIDEEVRSRGYETEIVPGIPSFCHGSALARQPLMIGDEGLAVVPMAKGNTHLLMEAMEGFDNIVVMKAFKAVDTIADMMEAKGLDPSDAVVVSNVGMEGEYIGPLDRNREYGYFTTVLIRKR